MSETSDFFNREAKDPSREAAANTGRKTLNVIDDVGQVQEEYRPLEERVDEGIGQIMEAEKLLPHQVNKEMHGFFLKRLQTLGKVTERDMRFNPEEVIAAALDKIARRKAA